MMIPFFSVPSFGETYRNSDEQTDPGMNNSSAAIPVDLSEMTSENAVTDELLVLTEKNTARKELKSVAEDAGASLDDVSTLEDGTRMASISLNDSSDAQAVADELTEDDSVLLVQPNYIYDLSEEYASADTGISPGNMQSIQMIIDEKTIDGSTIPQWYLESSTPGSTKSIEAWRNISAEGNKVTVAVIDTGASLDHHEIKDSIIKDKCVTFNGGKKGLFTQWDGADDDNGHGTHVCGLIAAKANDGIGMSGVSNDRADLIVIDAAMNRTKSFTTQDIVLAVDYAVRNGADIINLSVGGLFRDYIMDGAVDSAFNNNVLCVCAAGNENSSLVDSPGDAPGAISVMAHDRNGKKATFSNYGPERDVSAPGVDIISSYTSIKTVQEGSAKYVTMSGTSMAAPQVSGLAALLKSEDPQLSVRALKNLIYTSSGNGSFSSFGFGRINAAKAVENAHARSGPGSIVLNRKSRSMYPSESFALEYAVYPGTASIFADEIAFASSNTKVAKVDRKGNVKAIKAGTATITATCRGKKATCTIKVSNIPYVQIKKLAFTKKGFFSPTDPTLKFSYDKHVTEAMIDGYRLPATKVGKTVNIIVKSKKAIPYVRVFDPKGKELKVSRSSSGGTNGKEYTIKAKYAPKSGGRHRIQIMGISTVDKTVNKQYSLTIKGISTEVKKKAANPIKVKAKKVTIRYSKVKKKTRTLKLSKVMTVSKAKGKVTYTNLSGTSRIKINKKTGKVTVKRKTPRGKYRIIVKVHAAGNSAYKAANRYVKLTIRVK